MIIDGHTHTFHGESFDRFADIGGAWIRKLVAEEREQGKKYPTYFDVALRLEQLSEHGFGLQLVTPGKPKRGRCKEGTVAALNSAPTRKF